MKRLLPFSAILVFAVGAMLPLTTSADDPAPPVPAVVHGKGYKPLPPEASKALHDAAFKRHGYKMAWLAKQVTPPAEFDVRDMGWAGDSGDQGQCGSCFLCSTVKTATSAAVKAGLGKVNLFRLSWQYGMDCHNFGGCSGGNGTEVIDWMVKNGWPAEADPNQPPSALYPAYSAQEKQCRLPAAAKKFSPKDWLFITSDQSDKPATVAEYKAALLTYGMVNIAIDAGGQFSNYKSGVITSLGSSIDHEITVIGYSDAKQALLLENQWGQWGGAKTPGDDCAWLSYKAVGAVQDPFCVEFAAPEPPPTPPGPPVPPTPPTPPVPPGPPTTGNTVTVTQTLQPGTYKIVNLDAVVLTPAQTEAIHTILDGGTPGKTPTPPPPPAPKPPDKPMPKPEGGAE